MTPVQNDELIWHIYKYTIPAAMSLLPGRMDSSPSKAMLLTIGIQESGFTARQQGGTSKKSGEGPAKSWWQFEKSGGVQELLETPSTRAILTPICDTLGYPEWTAAALHEAMEHNDVLACVMARLLLYKDPLAMPESSESAKGWLIYTRQWRPGDAHPKTWLPNFQRAWSYIRT